MNLLLDTHVLLWWLIGDPGLSKTQEQALEHAEARGTVLGLSAISLWEIAKLEQKGRLRLHLAIDDLLGSLESHPRLQVLPLSARIALESTRLGARFHPDPADQIIVATARVHGLRLVTADHRIRKSAIVSIV
ncbi:MAG: type II toxin-antitoxin system VapC family toxin [Candidatus Riflebacteria bacterium]|nr:type II toxin-antitoxin system VapC family toxin [Candidatus Riflebacteria bacterium]